MIDVTNIRDVTSSPPQDGETFEKAGVGVSVVHGMIPASAVAQVLLLLLVSCFLSLTSPCADECQRKEVARRPGDAILCLWY